ncbi:MAG: alpha/beta fold hydrolase [Bdellovibrionales bacterium]|nr:alpha/beta fold hydrolase [Bdellovibrionales bacterium]
MDSNLKEAHPDVSGISILGDQTAILCLHGFTATPQTYSEFAIRAHAQTSHTILAPLLPGHGGVAEDLDSVTAQEWLLFTQKTLQEVTSTYKKIHLVGFSMGATLALLTYPMFANQISSLHLLAPALDVKTTFERYALHLMKVIPSKILKKIIRHKKGKVTDHLSYDHYSYYAARQSFELFEKAKKNIPDISAPTLIQYADKDPVIDPSFVLQIAPHFTNVDSRIIKIHSDLHIMLNSNQKDEIMKNMIEWIQKHK